MNKIESGDISEEHTLEQRCEIQRTNGHKQAHDPESMLDYGSSELEESTFELLVEALERGAKLSRPDAIKISERYSLDFFEGTRRQRERAAMIVTGILETFKDDLDISY